MLRFNQKGEFNIPVGNVDFNKNVLDALQDYFDRTMLRKITTCSLHYKDFLTETKFKRDDFVYLDPPYYPLNDTAYFTQYDKSDFNTEDQMDLKQNIDTLTDKGCKVLLSNSYCDFILELCQ